MLKQTCNGKLCSPCQMLLMIPGRRTPLAGTRVRNFYASDGKGHVYTVASSSTSSQNAAHYETSPTREQAALDSLVSVATSPRAAAINTTSETSFRQRPQIASTHFESCQRRRRNGSQQRCFMGREVNKNLPQARRHHHNREPLSNIDTRRVRQKHTKFLAKNAISADSQNPGG